MLLRALLLLLPSVNRVMAEWKRRAAQRDGATELAVGDVVQLAFSDVDRAKFDHTCATVIVVEEA